MNHFPSNCLAVLFGAGALLLAPGRCEAGAAAATSAGAPYSSSPADDAGIRWLFRYEATSLPQQQGWTPVGTLAPNARIVDGALQIKDESPEEMGAFRVTWQPEPAREIVVFGAAASAGQAPAPAVAAAGQWKSLFDGESLAGWKKPGFYKEGDVKVENPFQAGEGAIVMEAGVFMSGLKWSDADALPRTNYELELEAMKLEGDDFFCGLTFPVGESACSFIVGGWGGTVVGISSVDDLNASENEASRAMEFEHGRWYRIRVRVTPGRIEAWIDARQMIDLDTTNRVIGMYPGEIEYCLPLGFASYQTRAAVKNIRLRRL